MARSSFSRGGPPRGLLLLAYLAFAGLFLFACSSSTERQVDHGGFVSDDPDLGDSQYGGGSNGGTGGGGGGGGQGGAEDPERAIEEADIVQTAGDRLYALSRFGGLSVIDIGTQDRLTLLGRFKTEATPFEMYLRGNVVLALFDSYGWYGPNGDWRESSRVLSLDASDPRNVRVLSDTQLAGAVSDSRIVGDVLYVVSHENGYCWECSNTPRTTVTSFDIGSPAQTRQVDMLVFEDSEDDWGWARRSVSVTNQRMYVAGRDWDQTWGSKIQVVDISDPGGDMKLGTSLRAAGEIESRWQMDETDGVLRVISQPGVWNSSEPPELQTFAVESAQAVTHLASLQVLLPKPERLRSVRFDGARAFAITAEQTDPLFTFDLSDPAAPKQLGELEMPGWVYHMEPRGDRLLALGFDNASTEGALHVSIFDVSDLAKPTLLSRVNFGGAWADLPEDQDRIQKAFKLLEPEGLILVPFSGYGTSADPNCWGYTSGVQLIDWGTDSLATRGVAPSVGQARRAWVMNQRLFTVSDDRVETFDLADRDHPSRTAGLTLARNVARSAVVGDRVVRIGASWWSQATLLDVVNKSDASDPSALGELVVDGQSAQGCRYGGSYSELFTHDKTAYVVGSSYDYYYGDGMTTGVSVIDLSNPAEPALVNAYSLSSTGSGWWWSQS
ncbi:MAG: beta-propeller domain-containing protein, partial [Myxococcales bacterium]|nr:beta-propeller domain-containing protein [Myxococcales bacterium]